MVKKILIIGASGIGKSTIFNLILKFYQPNKGNIYILEESINVCLLPTISLTAVLIRFSITVNPLIDPEKVLGRVLPLS